MLRILRELNHEEHRRITDLAGVRPGAPPEEMIRGLSRRCGVALWGLFSTGAPDVLLDHMGRRLGLEPLQGGHLAFSSRERAVLACYLRLGWSAADAGRRDAVLRAALAAWDHGTLPPPPYDQLAREGFPGDATLEWLLQQSAGCRALAVAVAAHPLPLPAMDPPPLLGAVGTATVLAGVRPPGMPRDGGHELFYETLLVLWRARARLLAERRNHRAQLQRLERQLTSLMAVRQRDLATAPIGWMRNPLSGLAVAGGAALAVAVQTMLSAPGGPLGLAIATGTLGLLWSAAVASGRPAAAADRRILRMGAQLEQIRAQLAGVERDLRILESE